MTLSPDQIKQLQAPLDPRHVKPPPQGKYGEYIDGYHAVTEANRIFGYDGWSYAITSLAQCSHREAKDSRGGDQIRVGYRCTVRVTAGGVEREGAAVGSGMSKPENEADAHESAIKEAETDALKRALRSFGNTFGLALYDKTKAHVGIVEPDPDSPIPDATRDWLQAQIEASPATVGEVCKQFEVTSLKALKFGQVREVAEWLKQRKAA